MSLVMRKPVFGDLRPGSTQTGLLAQQQKLARVLKFWI